LLFMLFVSITKCSPTSTIFLHRVFCDFWISCRIEIFETRSMLIYPILHDTHLTSGFTDVFCFHRRSSCLHPLPTHRSVACTRQGVCLPFWHVWPCTPIFGGSQWFLAILTRKRLSRDGARPLRAASSSSQFGSVLLFMYLYSF